jgi:3-phenylpropionate/trans-cinnamate dioxygenase ferredoxin subunit
MSDVRVCAVVDVPAGEARRFPVDGHEVAVINLGTDGFRALDAVCSHEHFYLDEGDVDPDEGTIECPKHGSLFDVNSGKPLGLPAIKPVASYPVTVTDDDVWIEV